MAKISLTQRDVREALKDVVREEMQKENAVKQQLRLKEAKKINYGDNCPYCEAVVSLISKNGEWKDNTAKVWQIYTLANGLYTNHYLCSMVSHRF